MAHKGLLVRGKDKWFLVLEKVRESDSMHITHDVVIHAMDKKEST
jgi:hypothetical protein